MNSTPTIRKLSEPTVFRTYAEHLIGKSTFTPDNIAASLADLSFRVDIGNNFTSAPRFYEDTATSFLQSSDGDNSSGLNLPMIPFSNLPRQIRAELELPELEGNYFKCDKFLFISTINSYTGIHYDTADNLFLQVYGSKRFRLAPPAATPNMYMTKKYERGSRFSAVDGRERFDADTFPKLQLVRFIEISLFPGDVLFVPKKWWHCVETLSASVSVASFCMGLTSFLRSRLLDAGIETLHRLNLYGRNCNCCPK